MSARTRAPRLTYFVIGIAGGLVAGMGSIATWRTIEMGAEALTKGVDTVAGKITLGLAVATIVLALVTRKGQSEEPRTWPVICLLVSGIALTVIGGLGAAQVDAVYGDTRAADAERIATTLNQQGIKTTANDLLAQMDRVGTLHPGRGPWILLTGGVLVLVSAGAGLLWIRAWKRAAHPATDGESPQDGFDVAR